MSSINNECRLLRDRVQALIMNPTQLEGQNQQLKGRKDRKLHEMLQGEFGNFLLSQNIVKLFTPLNVLLGVYVQDST